MNTFSPEGRLFQVEYAIQAASWVDGFGIRPGGLVLAVEKRLTSPLLNADSVEKIMEVDSHAGAAMSGLIADARTLVDYARVEAQNHRFTYDGRCRRRADAGGLRPRALARRGRRGRGDKMSRRSAWRCSWRATTPSTGRAYYADPSGTFAEYKAGAWPCGEGAQSNPQEATRGPDARGGRGLALATLKQVMEDKLTDDNVDVARVTEAASTCTRREIAAASARSRRRRPAAGLVTGARPPATSEVGIPLAGRRL